MEAYKAHPPIFEKKAPPERYQVRFWSRPELYRQFVDEVERNEFVISDVFNQFMIWFAESSQQGVLPKRDTATQGEA